MNLGPTPSPAKYPITRLKSASTPLGARNSIAFFPVVILFQTPDAFGLSLFCQTHATSSRHDCVRFSTRGQNRTKDRDVRQNHLCLLSKRSVRPAPRFSDR